MPEYITDNIGISSDSDRKYSAGKFSTEENPDEENSNEENQV